MVWHYKTVICPNTADAPQVNSRSVNHFNVCNELIFVTHRGHIDVALVLVGIGIFKLPAVAGLRLLAGTLNSGLRYGYSLEILAVTPTASKTAAFIYLIFNIECGSWGQCGEERIQTISNFILKL